MSKGGGVVLSIPSKFFGKGALIDNQRSSITARHFMQTACAEQSCL
jgi:hypothetical protein